MSAKRDTVAVPRKLLNEAHACMRATGWHMAQASEPQSDGVIEAAVSDIERQFAALLGKGDAE